MNERPIDSVLDEAAHWMARLQSGYASVAETQAFQAWHDSHPQHAQVFQRMAQGLGQARRPALQSLGDEQVIRALNTPSSRRRFIQGSLGALAMLGVTGVGLQLAVPRGWARGDLYTTTGERRSFALAGGSRLTLNAQSRVSPLQGASQDELYLHHGTLQLECVGQPVVIDTAAARVDVTQGGRVLVERRNDGEVNLTVVASQVRLRTGQGDALRVDAGQRARLMPAAAPSIGRADPAASAWLSGLLQVHNRPLGEVVEALRAYRYGIVRVSPQAAQLRVSGLYPLDDSAKALRLIAASLPIRVLSYSDLWVSIELA